MLRTTALLSVSFLFSFTFLWVRHRRCWLILRLRGWYWDWCDLTSHCRIQLPLYRYPARVAIQNNACIVKGFVLFLYFIKLFFGIQALRSNGLRPSKRTNTNLLFISLGFLAAIQ